MALFVRELGELYSAFVEGKPSYGFPKQRAARIAVSEVQKYSGDIEAVFFVCFDSQTADIYRELLK